MTGADMPRQEAADLRLRIGHREDENQFRFARGTDVACHTGDRDESLAAITRDVDPASGLDWFELGRGPAEERDL